MAFSNKMTNLINKIERRLGTKPLNLPEDICKDKWADEVISNDTLDTFSRYFPHKFPYEVIPSRDKKGNYYLIDEDTIGSDVEIIGVKDINWDEFSKNYNYAITNYGSYGYIGGQYNIDDIGLLQMRADHLSLFNNGIFVDWEPPNKIRLCSTTGLDIGRNMNKFTIDLLLKHPATLNTISPTKMEVFEKLAIADVASFLYQYLKYYDGIETVYANIDLKMSEFEKWMDKRDEVVEQLKDGYVSMANDNQPGILTV